MKALGLQTLKVADIDFGQRLRQISEDHAQLLAQNMREVGRLRQPIEVRTRRAKAKGLPFLLIAGVLGLGFALFPLLPLAGLGALAWWLFRDRDRKPQGSHASVVS